MKREARDNTSNKYPKPVTKVELSDKHVKLRVILIICFVIIAGIFIGIALSRQFGTKAGWTVIQATYDENNNAGDFTFNYELGTKDISVSTEKNTVSKIYTESLIKIYQLLDEYTEFTSLKNIYYINNHCNEEIEIDSLLYECFERVQNNRYIYQSLILDQYNNLFVSDTDISAEKFDAHKNEELKEYYLEVLHFTNDSNHVNLELLGNNKVMLKVSAEYLNYMEENKNYISFGILKNACIIDYVSEQLIKNEFTTGFITSVDGYIRNLDKRDITYKMNVFDKEYNIYNAFSFSYKHSKSIVYLKNYAISSVNDSHYYEYKDGTRRTEFIDLNDGIDKAVVSNMVALSNDYSCLELLLEILPVYINESIDTSLISDLKTKNINMIYIDGREVHYNFNTTIDNLYSTDSISYEVIYDKD